MRAFLSTETTVVLWKGNGWALASGLTAGLVVGLAVAAGALLMLPRKTMPLADVNSAEPQNSSNPFATIRSSQHHSGTYGPKAEVQRALSVTDDPLTRSALITTAFTNWAIQDAKAASDYATTLEQADQTYAIAAVAPALAAKNPADAVQWAQSLSEEDARNLATHYVVNTWAGSQPTDAAFGTHII